MEISSLTPIIEIAIVFLFYAIIAIASFTWQLILVPLLAALPTAIYASIFITSELKIHDFSDVADC